MEFNNGITEPSRMAISEGLSRFLADTYALYLKTQNFHWNVRGPEFYSLHLLFEKQYQDLAEAVDEIAERIVALGFYVDATFSAFQKCCIKEVKKSIPPKKMIEQLVSDHEAVIRCAREIATLAEEEKDQATVDLMARRLGSHEKMAWMLRSHL